MNVTSRLHLDMHVHCSKQHSCISASYIAWLLVSLVALSQPLWLCCVNIYMCVMCVIFCDNDGARLTSVCPALPCVCHVHDLQYVDAAHPNTPGAADLELDNSHLDLLESSHILLQHDSDLEIEDSSTVWIAGGSSLSAHNNSKMEFRVSHVLVEGGSSVSLSMSLTWNVSQEWDVTPAQGRRSWLAPAQQAAFNAVKFTDLRCHVYIPAGSSWVQ